LFAFLPIQRQAAAAGYRPVCLYGGNLYKQQRSYADQDLSSSLLLKTEFPRMLKKLIKCLNMEELLPKAKNHMKLKAIYN
jgi:hypothetical protein